MPYRVIRVSTRSELKDFINLPFLIYRNDTNWIAPIKSEVKRVLNNKRNPFFRNASVNLFNCYKNGKIVSRVSLVVNNVFCEKTGIRTSFFGFFESFNDPEAVRVLFSEIFKYSSDNDIVRIEGPFNPNLYSELGMLCTSYDRQASFFQTYNPEYYNTLLRENGFKVLEVLHTRTNTNCSGYLNEKFKDASRFQFKDLTIRSFNKKRLKEDLEHLRNIFNDAFSENWHFTPVSKDEYSFSAKYLELVTPPELLQFIEFKGKPVAAVHFVLDVNPLLKKFRGKPGLLKYLEFLHERKKINKVIIFATGSKKAFHNTKVIQLLFNVTVEIARKYKVLETTWMYDENRSVISLAEKLGLERDKEFAIYYKNSPF